MRSIPFHRADVFTKTAFSGNPLAVFLEAESLSDDEMQKIAQEMNISETVFCLPPEDPEASHRLRIFTIDRELPMAGHPVVGAVHVLAWAKKLELPEQKNEIKLQLGVGTLPVEVIANEGEVQGVMMTQRLPEFGEPYADHKGLAKALGLEVDDLNEELPARVVDTGIPWFLIPIMNLRAMDRLAPDPFACIEIAESIGTDAFYAFSQDVEDPNCAAHGRHVWFGTVTPGEDPATGSAIGCTAAYLVHSEVVLAAPRANLAIEQGLEMGRPSRANALVDMEGGKISRVRVGGQAVHLAEGVFHL
ncbi:MAG: PhzF family phenazine biosynthesis protein [Planctomycetota bacterium]|jgi:trans-2,3-dihydro-3-hydroxyanthranilate isomerase